MTARLWRERRALTIRRREETTTASHPPIARLLEELRRLDEDDEARWQRLRALWHDDLKRLIARASQVDLDADGRALVEATYLAS